MPPMPVVLVIALLAVCSVIAAAQPPLPIHVIVAAADQAGNPIPGAYVTAQPYSSAVTSKEAHADGNGEAAFDLLPGSYTVVVADGCSLMWTQKLEVPDTHDFGIEVNAVLRPGAIIDCVQTTAKAPDLAPEMQVRSVPDAPIPFREMKTLPVRARRKRRL